MRIKKTGDIGVNSNISFYILRDSRELLDEDLQHFNKTGFNQVHILTKNSFSIHKKLDKDSGEISYRVDFSMDELPNDPIYAFYKSCEENQGKFSNQDEYNLILKEFQRYSNQLLNEIILKIIQVNDAVINYADFILHMTDNISSDDENFSDLPGRPIGKESFYALDWVELKYKLLNSFNEHTIYLNNLVAAHKADKPDFLSEYLAQIEAKTLSLKRWDDDKIKSANLDYVNNTNKKIEKLIDKITKVKKINWDEFLKKLDKETVLQTLWEIENLLDWSDGFFNSIITSDQLNLLLLNVSTLKYKIELFVGLAEGLFKLSDWNQKLKPSDFLNAEAMRDYFQVESIDTTCQARMTSANYLGSNSNEWRVFWTFCCKMMTKVIINQFINNQQLSDFLDPIINIRQVIAELGTPRVARDFIYRDKESKDRYGDNELISSSCFKSLISLIVNKNSFGPESTIKRIDSFVSFGDTIVKLPRLTINLFFERGILKYENLAAIETRIAVTEITYAEECIDLWQTYYMDQIKNLQDPNAEKNLLIGIGKLGYMLARFYLFNRGTAGTTQWVIRALLSFCFDFQLDDLSFKIIDKEDRVPYDVCAQLCEKEDVFIELFLETIGQQKFSGRYIDYLQAKANKSRVTELSESNLWLEQKKRIPKIDTDTKNQASTDDDKIAEILNPLKNIAEKPNNSLCGNSSTLYATKEKRVEITRQDPSITTTNDISSGPQETVKVSQYIGKCTPFGLSYEAYLELLKTENLKLKPEWREEVYGTLMSIKEISDVNNTNIPFLIKKALKKQTFQFKK